jgi:hypothetical protein
MTTIVDTDKCRVCGCTPLNPCLFAIGGPGEPLEPCAWLDSDHTLCTNPRCVATVPLRELERMPLMPI